MSKKNDKIQFRLLGGSRQMIIRTGEDVRRVAGLDPVHWTMNGIQTDSMIGDPEFIKLMDSDNSGRIRCDEVQNALNWMLLYLKDLTGVEQKTDFLSLDSLREDTPEGKHLAEAIRIALDNLGFPDANGVSFGQLCDREKIVSNSLQNGDGIIPPDPVAGFDPVSADCIRSVMALIGVHKDKSGEDGINADDLATFENQAAGYLTWRTEAEKNHDTIFPFGDQTKALYDTFCAIREKTDAFFRSVAALRFGAAAPANALTCDPLDPDSVKVYLEKAPICNPALSCELKRGDDSINPFWCGKVGAFFDACSLAFGRKIESADASFWAEVSAKLAPYEAWLGKKNTALFDAFDVEKLQRYAAEGVYDKIRKLMTADVDVAEKLALCAIARKLMLFQKNMLVFLNNFVSLSDLFDVKTKSMIQVGRLVMDGRVFTLCTLVPNPAEHKKIVQDSDICVMYLDVSNGLGPTLKTMKLAVAVTSGHVRNIFIGKQGVFYTDDGVAWDAKVFDFVKQPVSISEAIKAPFYKFGEFLQKQADKYFSTRSKTYEDNVAKDIQSKTAPVPAPAAPAKVQTPAVSGSMMLMGGGIGIAAIGSAFAFMAKSLQGISVGTVLAVFLGILLIFGGPIIITSLVKLFHRNLSRFFEANGYAINRQMRLSPKMGSFFTYTPKMPLRSRTIAEAIISGNSEERSSSIRAKIFWWIVLILILAACGWIFRTQILSAFQWCKNFFSAL